MRDADLFERDRRDFETFKNETAKPTRDIKTDVGTAVNTSTWALKKALISKEERSNPAMIALKWGMDQLKTAKERHHARFLEAMPFLAATQSLTTMTRKGTQEFVKKALDIERTADQWFNGKDYYPDEAHLKKVGFSDSQIEVYNMFAKSSELIWKMHEQIALKTDKEPPPRLPGYIPHFWKGGYKVVLKDKEGHLSHVLKYDSRREAEQMVPFIKDMASKYQLSFEFRNNKIVHEPDFTDRSYGDVLHGLEMISSQLKGMRGKDPKKWGYIMDAIDAHARQTFAGSTIERLDIPVRGHEMDLIANGNNKKIDGRELTQMLSQEFGRVNDLLASVEAIHEVWRPLVTHGYLDPDFGKSWRVFDNALAQFVGLDRNALKMVDSAVQKSLNWAGVNPDLGRLVATNISGLASVFYLVKAAFLHATLIQPLKAVNILRFFDAWLDEKGVKNPNDTGGSIGKSVLKAYAKYGNPARLMSNFQALKDTPNLKLTHIPEIKEAIMRGAISPAMIDDIFPSKGIYRAMLPAKKLEMFSRLSVYMMALDYATDRGLRGQKAHDIAVEITDAAMVPYSANLGRPFGFESFGLLGKAFTTFLTYTAHEAGSLYTEAKSIGAFQSKKAKFKALRAIIEQAAIMGTIGGVAGIPFVNNIDSIIEKINEWFNKDWPTSKLAAYRLASKIPGEKTREVVGDIAAFGAYNYGVQGVASMFTDDPPLAHLTASMGGLSFMEPTAVFEMTANLANLAMMSTSEASKDKSPSRKAWKEATTNMPWMFSVAGDYILKNKNVSDAWDMLMNDKVSKENPDIMMDKYNKANKEGYLRTDEDRKAIRNWWTLGSRSVNEEKVKLILREFQRQVRLLDQRKADYLQLLSEDTRFQNLPPRQKEALLEEMRAMDFSGWDARAKEELEGGIPYNRMYEESKSDPDKLRIYEELKKTIPIK